VARSASLTPARLAARSVKLKPDPLLASSSSLNQADGIRQPAAAVDGQCGRNHEVFGKVAPPVQRQQHPRRTADRLAVAFQQPGQADAGEISGERGECRAVFLGDVTAVLLRVSK